MISLVQSGVARNLDDALWLTEEQVDVLLAGMRHLDSQQKKRGEKSVSDLAASGKAKGNVVRMKASQIHMPGIDTSPAGIEEHKRRRGEFLKRIGKA